MDAQALFRGIIPGALRRKTVSRQGLLILDSPNREFHRRHPEKRRKRVQSGSVKRVLILLKPQKPAGRQGISFQPFPPVLAFRQGDRRIFKTSFSHRASFIQHRKIDPRPHGIDIGGIQHFHKQLIRSLPQFGRKGTGYKSAVQGVIGKNFGPV